MIKSSIKVSVAILLPLIVLILLTLAYARPQGISPISLAITKLAKRDYAWQCQPPIVQKQVSGRSNIIWTKRQCNGTYPFSFLSFSRKSTGPLIINVLDINLADNHSFIKPAMSAASAKKPYLSNLSALAQQQSRFIAGINGGYFRSKIQRTDYNCKTRPVSTPLSQPNDVGDGLLVIDTQVYSTNCPNSLFSEPGRSTLLQDATTKQWRIEQVNAGVVPSNTLNALGAGPGLIQTIDGKPQIRVTWEGIPSTFEFSANTAVILANDAKGNPHMLLFTVDGVDHKWGMTSLEMANFIYHQIPKLFQVQLVSAMSMDQGNSTAMYVKDANKPIVSVAGRDTNQRDIYDGLFVVAS